MDEYTVNKYYEVSLLQMDGITRVFYLSEDDFNKNIELLKWIEFLVLTNQWIPFPLYQDAFGINETLYKGLDNVENINIKFIESVVITTEIDLDLL